MIRVSDVVEEMVLKSPFIESGIAEGIINISALARKIRPQVQIKCKKKVEPSAIIMALKRLEPKFKSKMMGSNQILKNLGKLIVRSKLSEYTFRNDAQLVKSQVKLIEKLQDQKDNFFIISTGIFETTIICDMSNKSLMSQIFISHEMDSHINNLSSITIELPPDNVKIHGVYYQILKAIAWSGINIYQTISTSNELTIIFANKDVNDALAVLNNINA